MVECELGKNWKGYKIQILNIKKKNFYYYYCVIFPIISKKLLPDAPCIKILMA